MEGHKDLSGQDGDAQTEKNEEKEEKEMEGRRLPSVTTAQRKSKPFSVQFELDFMQCALFLGSIFSRTWQLGLPRAVVFDELHFAKFVTLYLKGIFFFDVHPPLGKLLLALAGDYTGFDPRLETDINFDRIGAGYSPDFPVYQLRLVPAVLGSAVVPLVYQIAAELGLSRWAAMIAGAFILLDNALLVQSRFMLMEGMLLFFMCLSILSLLKFRNLGHREFSLQWWLWLAMTGLSFTCTLSIKHVGFFTAILVLYIVTKDYWTMLADVSLSDFCLWKHFAARAGLLVTVPMTMYIYIYYIHLSLLTKAGPHDSIMTSAFQASLEGGLAALTRGQPLYVAFGSQITLRHTFDPVPGKPCWLHSHAHVYPIRYQDGRGSSHQQQVTCYIFKDINNWWIIKHPEKDSMVADDPPVAVKHGDIVQLVHGITSRALNSHDVAAPLTPQNQEVTCYIDYNVSMPAQNLWRVEIVNRDGGDDKWQTIKSHVRLVHVNTSQALKMTGKQLPEWGFHQLEVATDRLVNQDSTIWNVEEHRYTRTPDKDGQIRDLSQAEMIPLEPTHLSFFDKFLELQYRILFIQGDTEMEHKYSSTPLDWPLSSKNLAYWMHPVTNAQIHLLGNPVVWIAGTLSIIIYAGLFFFYLMRQKRGFQDLPTNEWHQFVFIGDLLVIGYLLHYLPFFLTDSTLFLHNYLPCVIFKVLALASVIDHLDIILYRVPHGSVIVRYTILALLMTASWTFYRLSVFTYGNVDLTAEQITSLAWRESWDFLVHLRVGF
ncbi:hypothetical protein CHS0354_017778 [Potamilus streckersoni]|uniref:dolichyl-phosphate-mannose--protein mannosyltransferase n=1 Tax=Potamilus streckersoni TaxID=2493646 RepID=A0AAE0T9X3_9BIVA|nr:hypothetical protein CHS0354_017778 [Potamilus streckersoni]